MELDIQKRTPAMASPDIERWDDDDFENLDDMHIRTASTATSIISHPQSNHRDSLSSRLSMRSDSNQGDENWDVLVDDKASITDAVALARSKGIPLPTNVPRSALEGGTIRRLRGKEIKKAITDDWSEDLDFGNAPTQLKLAKAEDRDLSESFRQISAAFHGSPISPGMKDGFDTIRSVKSRPAPTPISLDQFKDNDDDDGFGEVPTIRVAKHRTPQKMTLFTSPAQIRPKPHDMDDIEEDLELPSDGQLKLSARKQLPRTPQIHTDDFDMEWAEGSLGTRQGGKRVMSNRSSSVGALSPSVSSAFTAESEDEGLDGLVLPTGPIRFEEILKRKQEDRSPELISQHFPPTKRKVSIPSEKEWDEDLIIPDGEVFDAAKLSLNRNVKHKPQRPQSPGKRATTTLSFTSNKQQATLSRLPRFQSAQDRHDRARSNLEPVSETGAPLQKFQRPGSRLGHTQHSSVSSIQNTSIPTPSTPSRRGLRNAESRTNMRYEPPTTTNAQLLRAKRSMPMIRDLHSPTKPQLYTRPPSRQDGTGSRLHTSRPKTPTERSESRLAMDKRGSIPFLPAGITSSQSQHISTKTTATRHIRRNDSEGSNESMSAAQRSLSRIVGFRPETPGKGKSTYTAAELAAQAKKTMTKPARRRNFGDGSELEIFDDLPTSASAESKFIKQPVGRGAPRSLRSKLGQTQFAASTTSLVSARGSNESPMPTTPMSPLRSEFPTVSTTHTTVPRFARDTAASRNAREQRQISTTFQNVRGEPLQPISANWKTQPSLRPTSSLRNKKRNVQQKPHLIKPMGNDLNRSKEEKGMSYNPVLFRWEGNENALAPFDVPEFNPRGQSPVLNDGKGNLAGANTSPNSKSNVALIMNVGGNSGGVQVVGGMVFDPRQMKWLKLAEGGSEGLRGGSGSVKLEEEEDVFAGLEDLKEDDEQSIATGPRNDRQSITSPEIDGNDFGEDVTMQDVGNNSGHSDTEWPGVAEEFDVGPAFIKRQRDEEDRWKRKVEKWLRNEIEVAAEEIEGSGGWRWAIRDLVCEGMTAGEIGALV